MLLVKGMGPPKTFEQIYDDHFDYALYLARLFGAPAGWEEDVVQEVFLSLYQRMKQKRFLTTMPVRAWVRAGIYWKARDIRCAASVWSGKRGVVREEGFDLADCNLRADVERSLSAREEGELLLKFLEELEFERRAVFVLKDILGHTLEEIGQDLKISPSTASTRLLLARQDLEAILRRHQAEQARKTRGAFVPVTLEGLVASVQACSFAMAVPLGARERVWARLQEKIRALPDTMPDTMPDSTPALDPSWMRPRFRDFISGGAGFVAGVVATLLLAVALRHREPPPPPPPSERAPVVVVAPTDPVTVPAILPARTAAAPTAPATPTASSAAPQDDPDAETAAERRCLRAVRAALDAKPPNPRKALDVLDECAERFPTSHLPAQRARLRQEAEAALSASRR